MTHPVVPSPAGTAPAVRIVITGHVDHGKSTLIGRLLHDTGSLPDGKLEELRAISRRRGMPLEWSFALDSLQAERDQAVTIDTTRIRFRSAVRDVEIIDAPGHREFLKNMISGAASADAALLVIDAVEGVREQTRRHAYLLHLLGVRQLAVAVNKMDLVGFSEARFAEVVAELETYLRGLGLAPLAVVPVSARDGDGIATAPASAAWYDGPHVLAVIDGFAAAVPPGDRPLRLPVQDVYKFDERRILAGRVEAGVLRSGDAILVSPSNRTARVRSIEVWNGPAPAMVEAGRSVGITLDDQIFVERGDVLSHADRPPRLTDVARATLFWLGRQPLEAGAALVMKLATRAVPVTVQSIERVIDTDTLEGCTTGAIPHNGVGEVVLRARDLFPFDDPAEVPGTGRFVLLSGHSTVAGGHLSPGGYPDQRASRRVGASNLVAMPHAISPAVRAARYGHSGGVLWLTGLSGAGKSTLAMALERRLFAANRVVCVLDGDNVRHGLNRDLGFSPEDRMENIRRVGEVAALFAGAGLICITAFISPFRADRDRARAAAKGAFHEVWVKADLETCERRDPKGLYRKARAGQIADFTGISSPYEPPDAPELTIDTATRSVEESVADVLAYIDRVFEPPPADPA